MPRRRHLFEWEDLPWFPHPLREAMTAFLVAVHRAFRSDRLFAPVVARAVQGLDERRIVDLCSGSGGAMPAVVRELERAHGLEVQARLTDLYPNLSVARRFNAVGGNLAYVETSVDATSIPPGLEGIRTMVLGFHHLPPDVARAVLADAFRSRRPILIFELTANTPVGWLAALAIPLLTLFVLPLMRPFRWWYVPLTYIVPLLPFLVFWDGLVSSLRTYSPAELEEMTSGLRAPDYEWEIGTLRHFALPFAPPYLVGRPVAR